MSWCFVLISFDYFVTIWLLVCYGGYSMQSITIIEYQLVIKTWYKYGLSVPYLTIIKHK